MTIKVGINGFGRIGRMVFRAAFVLARSSINGSSAQKAPLFKGELSAELTEGLSHHAVGGAD